MTRMKDTDALPGIWRLGLAAVMVVFLGLGAAYIWLKPLGQAPDEHDHVTYILFLMDAGTFPRMWTPQADGIGQGDEPPLYYLSLLGAYQIFGPTLDSPKNHPAGYRTLRLISLILFGLGTLIVTVRLSRILAPGDGPVAFLTCALTGFLPMFLHMATSVNNGLMADFMCTTLLVLGVAGLSETAPSPLGHHVLRGAVLAGALLAKMTVLPVVAAAGPVFLWLAWRSPRRTWALMGLAAPLILIAAPWFIRNMILYGDPVAFSANMETFFKVEAMSPRGLDAGHLPGLWMNFLGVFGFGQVPTGITFFPGWVYLAALAATAAALVLGPLAARWRGVDCTPLNRGAAGFLAAAVVLTLVFFYYTNWRIQHLQMRYLFVVVAVLAFWLARSTLRPFPPGMRAGVAVLAAGAALTLSVWGTWLLDPNSLAH